MLKRINRYRVGPRRARIRPAALELLEERCLLSIGGHPLAIWEGRGWHAGVNAKPAIIGVSATPAAPVPITLHLAGSSAPAGDYVDVASTHVVLTGQTAPGATVRLRQARSPRASCGRSPRRTPTPRGPTGSRCNCGMGTTAFTAQVVEAAGVASSASLSVTRANQAIVWNSIALQAVRNAK